MVRNNKVIKVLSIDGGGIKGIIPIVILEYIKSELVKKGIKLPLYRVFDVIAGTSTGGIIALALSSPTANTNKPLSLKELLNFYEVKSSYIFHSEHSAFFKAFLALFKPPYDPLRFEKELYKIFGDETLKDLLTDVYIPSLNPITYEIKNFNRINIKNTDKENFYIRDIARATSAEPSLFPPAKISPINKTVEYCLIDGGFYALNPSLNAYLYAKSKYPYADKYVILSLGTGSLTNEYTCKEMSKWGLGNWIAPWNHVQLLRCCTQGQINNANDLLSHINDVKLFRFDPKISFSEDTGANVSTENIIDLEKIAIHYVKKEMKRIYRLVNFLV